VYGGVISKFVESLDIEQGIKDYADGYRKVFGK